MDRKKMDRHPISLEERESTLSSIIQSGLSEIDHIKCRKIRNRKSKHPSHITALNSSSEKLKPFIVGDIETLLIDNVHTPYAAGLMLVRPGEEIKKLLIDSYFSEDYSIIFDSEKTLNSDLLKRQERFKKKSTKVLYDLVKKISILVRKEKSALNIDFHNLSSFDGIFLLKHLACHHSDYKLKPLMSNNRLYELAVYSGKKKLFCFRDSLHLIPGSLQALANNLCSDLGTKGSIDHEKVNLSNLTSLKKQLLEYMEQDILLLGGVMKKAQDIYWNLFKIDIVSKITLSSLALSIFRMRYYDPSNLQIHIPNKNEDTFIRRAYYGGHTDVYKPYGEDLYYYDVNSLYPFVMKEFPMPGGKPVWHGNLEGMPLDSLFGFIEADVECPKTIKKPFLPYRDKNDTLIFPTGEFVGVYYSEELKYARKLGYTVLPISGYLFEEKESPFKEYVSSIFENRLEAKKKGNEALSFVYKTLMNSLYGRFGINPISTITEICDQNRYNSLIRNSKFIFGDMISENNYIVSYHSNTMTENDYWNPPKNSAVQLAAAITASARIYMYPYISREDSYYTDTDSVVLSQPLPEEVVSSSVLGKLKLENRIKKGYFLAPKAYCFDLMMGKEVLKFKGLGKEAISKKWFESQFSDPSRTEVVTVVKNFSKDWKSLDVIKKEALVTLGIKQGSKRKPVFHGDVWMDTDPIEIQDLSNLNNIGKQIVKSLRNSLTKLFIQNKILNEKLSQKEKDIAERYKEQREEVNTEDEY
uniref:DNA polymerase n=1 Tax=Sesuvium portulacastrum TaxID=221166 RepID=A0A6B9MLS4_SESPO|nr:DNA polymerase [Sesuvium portulacastrum]